MRENDIGAGFKPAKIVCGRDESPKQSFCTMRETCQIGGSAARFPNDPVRHGLLIPLDALPAEEAEESPRRLFP